MRNNLTDHGGKYMLFSLNFAHKKTILSTLKENDSCKTYYFRIEGGNGSLLSTLRLTWSNRVQ